MKKNIENAIFRMLRGHIINNVGVLQHTIEARITQNQWVGENGDNVTEIKYTINTGNLSVYASAKKETIKEAELELNAIFSGLAKSLLRMRTVKSGCYIRTTQDNIPVFKISLLTASRLAKNEENETKYNKTKERFLNDMAANWEDVVYAVNILK